MARVSGVRTRLGNWARCCSGTYWLSNASTAARRTCGRRSAAASAGAPAMESERLVAAGPGEPLRLLGNRFLYPWRMVPGTFVSMHLLTAVLAASLPIMASGQAQLLPGREIAVARDQAGQFTGTVKLAARFADALNVPDDVPVHQVKEFAPHLSFGGSASNPGLVALSLLDQWQTFRSHVTDWQRMSVYYAAITSEGRGRVMSFPRMKDPVVTYRLTHRDRELLRSGLARLTLLMLEAGAVEVFPSFKGAPSVRNRRDVAAMQQAFSASKATVMTVHLCSTVPMGEITERCGADSFGLVHGMRNVHVNDASLLPTAPGVNPQASVMAFAIRNARHFVATGGSRA